LAYIKAKKTHFKLKVVSLAYQHTLSTWTTRCCYSTQF